VATESTAQVPVERQPPATDGLPVPKRYWAIAAIVLALSLAVLDSSIANIALPTVARDFRVTDAASVWVINSYQITVLVALLPLASVGETVGYRRVSQAGLVVFTVASLACAAAPSLTWLALARVTQGLGAAGIMSVNAALVRAIYPRAMLGRAVGINAFAVATSAAIGPTLAAAVMAVSSWRWLFAVNVPMGIATLAVAAVALPPTERGTHRPSWVGAFLHIATFGLSVGGLQVLAHRGATGWDIAQLCLGCLVGVVFVRYELTRARPLIPFDLLRERIFTLSLITSVCTFVAQSIAMVALPFAIQRTGRTAVDSGLLLTSWAVAVAVAAPFAGRLSDRYSAGVLGSLGLVAMSAALGLLAIFPADGSSANFTWRLALCGVGFGFFQAPNLRTILSAVPHARSGAAGAMVGTSRQLGQALGATFVALLFRWWPHSGPPLALSWSAGLSLVGALVSSARLSAGKRAL
jgi:DHA2 family multidrug resistance protein-like MFS transporter